MLHAVLVERGSHPGPGRPTRRLRADLAGGPAEDMNLVDGELTKNTLKKRNNTSLLGPYDRITGIFGSAEPINIPNLHSIISGGRVQELNQGRHPGTRQPLESSTRTAPSDSLPH